MYPNNSPLENLFAFSIVFAAGVVGTVVLARYLEKVKQDADSCAAHSAQES